ncbi:MAG: HAMP domain-containing histidine kinase [Spirochaetales bacterium]|nr:HAMP domain-containing histidine kinase [Spirochaetales bacterium]
MRIGLKARLIFSILPVNLITVVILIVVVNFFLDSQFKEYAVRRQERKNRELVQLISRQYAQDRSWNTQVIQNIGISVLEESILLRLTDARGGLVWDAMTYNSGICQAMIQQMSQRMLLKYPSINGGLQSREYDVTVDGRTVGRLTVGYYGPFFYTDSDLYFIETLNNVLLAAAAIAVVLSVIAGYVIASTISAPLKRAADQAVAIGRGDYHPVRGVRSSTREIRELTDTLDRMTETVVDQERLRRRLATDVAHELRTPLAALQGEMEAMIDGVSTVSRGRLESCLEEIRRLAKLTGDMETLARYDDESIVPRPARFDLGALLEKTAARYEKSAREAGLTLVCRPQAVSVLADEELIGRVIINLLANAVKFNVPGGTVDASVSAADGRARIVVRDTGRGIPAADLPHVFERFYRVDQSRTRSAGGAGIGLSIVRAIVRAHGGAVDIRSEPGKGTEVTVSLPVDGPGGNAGLVYVYGSC